MAQGKKTWADAKVAGANDPNTEENSPTSSYMTRADANYAYDHDGQS